MWIRMCDADVEKFGGQAWVHFDEEALADTRARELADYETQIGTKLVDVLLGQTRPSMTAIRALLWIGRRQAGVVETYDSFDPLPLKCRLRRTKPDGDDDTADGADEQSGPPSPPSSPPSSDTVPSAKRTSGTNRRSRG